MSVYIAECQCFSDILASFAAVLSSGLSFVIFTANPPMKRE